MTYHGFVTPIGAAERSPNAGAASMSATPANAAAIPFLLANP
jgi:hypothetical protein